jgi:hypothetical protein
MTALAGPTMSPMAITRQRLDTAQEQVIPKVITTS